MDRFDLLTILGELFPKLTAAVVVLALIFVPRPLGAEIVSVGKEEGRRITVALESVIAQAHRPHHHQPKHPTGKASSRH